VVRLLYENLTFVNHFVKTKFCSSLVRETTKANVLGCLHALYSYIIFIILVFDYINLFISSSSSLSRTEGAFGCSQHRAEPRGSLQVMSFYHASVSCPIRWFVLRGGRRLQWYILPLRQDCVLLKSDCSWYSLPLSAQVQW
jgi:hypothetical protein